MNGSNPRARWWLEITLFVLVGFVSIGLPIVPMGLAANSIVFPDIMFAAFSAWIIRRQRRHLL